MSPENAEAVIAFSTVDSEEAAKKIARALVEGRLAACVNIIPKILSIYEWKKEICEESETLLLIQTHSNSIQELKATIKELHPYEVPMLLVLPITDALEDYLRWMVTCDLQNA